MSQLVIKNLHVQANEKSILKGINFTFQTGKTYAIIGPNGNGKSTLLSALSGDPNYQITQGEIKLDNLIINDLAVDQRVQAGIYLCMQYPSEITGVSNFSLLQSALSKQNNHQLSQIDLLSKVNTLANQLRIDQEMIMRDVNVGFSGGEKKKNEILHLFMLNPKFAFLDEIDSGLDVDSIKAVAKLIKKAKSEDRAFIIVSHYQELYQMIKPDIVLIIKNGKIIQKGDYQLLINTLKQGFDHENY